jgi:HSP20 family protein
LIGLNINGGYVLVKKAIDKIKGQLSEEEFFLGDNMQGTDTDWLAQAQTEGQLAVDMYQTEHDIVIKAPIAGVPEKDIDITVQPEQVIIRGERKEEKLVDEDQYHMHECFWGSFSRMVMLPVEGDPDKARATFKNGILTIKIPKSKRIMAVKLSVGE